MIITDSKFEALVGQINDMGFTNPFIINTDNVIVCGHSRRKALIQLGRDQEEVPVRVPNRMLTEEEFTQINIGDNRYVGAFDAGLLTKNFDPDLLLQMGFQKWELGSLNNDLIATMNTYGERPAPQTLQESRAELTDGDLFPSPPEPGNEQNGNIDPAVDVSMAFEVMLKLPVRRAMFELIKGIREEYQVENVSTVFEMIIATIAKARTHADFSDIFVK